MASSVTRFRQQSIRVLGLALTLLLALFWGSGCGRPEPEKILTRSETKLIVERTSSFATSHTASSTSHRIFIYGGTYSASEASAPEDPQYRQYDDAEGLRKALATYGFLPPDVDFERNVAGMMLIPQAYPKSTVDAIFFKDGAWDYVIWMNPFFSRVQGDGPPPYSPRLVVAEIPRTHLER